MASRSIRLAVIPGDGIGPEVVAEGLKVLEAVAPSSGLAFEQTSYDLGAARWHRTGETLPDSVLDELREQEVDPAGRRRRPERPERRPGARPAAAGRGSSSTTTSTCAR